MNILHLCLGNYFCEGAGYQENLLAKYHRALGHDVTVIASVDTFDSEGRFGAFAEPGRKRIADGTSLIRLPYLHPAIRVFQKLRRFKGLKAQLVESAPDLLFIHNTQFLDADIVAAYLQANPSVRAVADFHSDEYNSARNLPSRLILHGILWKRAFRQLAPHLRRIYCTTPNVRKFVSQHYGVPDHLLSDLRLAADDEAIEAAKPVSVRETMRNTLRISANEVVVVHGGKLDQDKGTIELVRAFTDGQLNATLLIFGTATPDVRNVIDSAVRCNQQIRYLGWIKSSDVYRLYRSADIACFPGTQSVLWQQAIASGLPLVCKYWPKGEYLDCGGNVMFLPSQEPSVIRMCLRLMLTNQSLVRSMAGVSAQQGTEQFSYRRLAEQVISDAFHNSHHDGR